MCNNYDPDGNSDTSTGSCMHKCACGMNKYYGCWYDECVHYANCPAFDSHYWDEKKAENKARNAEILAQRGIQTEEIKVNMNCMKCIWFYKGKCIHPKLKTCNGHCPFLRFSLYRR